MVIGDDLVRRGHEARGRAGSACRWRVCRPMLGHRLAVAQTPTLASSATKAVLTDCAWPWTSVIWPPRCPRSYATCQARGPCGLHVGEVAHVEGVLVGGALTSSLSGMPFFERGRQGERLERRPGLEAAGAAVGLVDAVVDRRAAACLGCWRTAVLGHRQHLPVPGSTTAAAAPILSLLPGGTRFPSSCWACFWIFGSRVVWMVSPPRLSFVGGRRPSCRAPAGA